MHLSTSSPPDRKAEQSGGLSVPIHLELSEAGSMTLNWLTDFTFNRVELHGTNNPVLLWFHHKKKKSHELDIIIISLGKDTTHTDIDVHVNHLCRLACL